ncbi:MAG TPA: 3'-5' exonuclease [Opitutaceae bacterium]|nr:3'-5' exonuclease [Opitutaceae bacterium]
MSYVIFDLETTGLSPRYHEIIQVAALRLSSTGEEAGAAFSTFVRPQRRIPSHITELTGIDQSMVACAPAVAEALARFSAYADGATLVAHNGWRFDLRFIASLCERAGLGLRVAPFIDTRRVSQAIWPEAESHGLDAVSERLQLSLGAGRRHDARGDVQLLAAAFVRMKALHAERFSDEPLPVLEGWLPCLGNAAEVACAL